MRKITRQEYEAIHPDFAGIWTTERDDIPEWPNIRDKYMGKRTMMAGDGTCTLLIEGLNFEIIEQDPEACPGCGCLPGDGLTPGCNHEDGCGYLREYETA